MIGYYAAHAQEKQMSTVNEFIKNHGLNKVKPSILEMTYNGVTYLPLRMIGNLFNFNVQWDG
jgi:hypothetical protein